MKKGLLIIFASIYTTLIVAQEETKKVDVNINKDSSGSNWYTSPFVWVVVAAVFILLLVALTRSGGRRE